MHGRKSVSSEWPLFKRHGLDSKEWLVQKSTPDYLQIVHRTSGEVKVLNWENTNGNNKN